MSSESIDFADILIQRRASAEQTIRYISEEELQEIREKLFPQVGHPWEPLFKEFVEEHRHERPLHGETSDGYSFIYYPRTNKGIWYQHAGSLVGVGPLGDRGLQTLSEIVDEKNL